MDDRLLSRADLSVTHTVSRGRSEGVPTRRNSKEKKKDFSNVQSYKGENRLNEGEIGHTRTGLHFRFSFCMK